MRTSRLSSLYDADGPFATVLVDVSHDAENGEHEHELRVRAATEDLRAQGAPDEVVQEVSTRLGELVRDASPVGRLVVATATGVQLDEVVHARVDQPVVTWSPLPDLARWIEHQDALTPFVLAVVDHEGGDVAVYESDVPEPDEQATVGGETQHVHKVPVGGWSALRYQHVTENVWARNAEAAADEIVSHVRSGHHLVLLAGDPQSKPVVKARLESTPATLVELETGRRAEDGGDEAFQQAIREALLGQAVARRLETSHELKERMGAGTAVATGVDDVADAFVRGQVQTLLVDPQGAEDLTLEVARHPGLALGWLTGRPEKLPASQALVAAAVLTSADVRVEPSAAMGGTPVSALLRWDQEAVGSES
jgi:hypothetical protein